MRLILETGLHTGSTTSRVNIHMAEKMSTAQRLAISKGQAKTPWLRALHRRGFTQNGLAALVGMSPALLSLCRKGVRPIHRGTAAQIAELTGWPAKKWPGGFIEE